MFTLIARGIMAGMPVIKDHAVILRRLDFSENSQVLALFTRDHGKVRAIAKGVKRSTKTRFAPAPDLLDVGSAVLSAKSADRERLAILTEWTSTQPLTGLRDEITRLYAAQYAAALTAELTEDWDPHIELFDALVRALTGLAHGEPPMQCVLRFQRTLLDSVGSMPELDRCVGCQNPVASDGPVYLSSFDGGLLCRDCEAPRSEKYLLSRPALASMRGAVDGPVNPFGAISAFDYHLTHLMGRRLPLSGMILKLLK